MDRSELSSEIQKFEDHYAVCPDSLVFARLADLYRRDGDPERALQILRKGLKRRPGYLSAHLVRARTHLDLGETVAAGETYERVLDLDDRNLVAMRSLARLARMRGDPAQARRWYERLRDLDPRRERVERRLAELSEAESSSAPTPAAPSPDPDVRPDGDRTGVGADEDSPDAAPDSRGDGVYTPTLAALYARQGLFEEAVRIYEELVRRHPGDESLRRALRRARKEETPEPLQRSSPGLGAREGEPASPDRRREDP